MFCFAVVIVVSADIELYYGRFFQQISVCGRNTTQERSEETKYNKIKIKIQTQTIERDTRTHRGHKNNIHINSWVRFCY